jgi:hypothetical protein
VLAEESRRHEQRAEAEHGRQRHIRNLHMPMSNLIRLVLCQGPWMALRLRLL